MDEATTVKDRINELCVAIWENQFEKVKTLLSDPSTSLDIINGKSSRGQTPLYCAARQGLTPIVILLLNIPEIDTDIPNKQGSTPLHAAGFYNHIEITALLLYRGALPSITNRINTSAREDAGTETKQVYEALDAGGVEQIAKQWPICLELSFKKKKKSLSMKNIPRRRSSANTVKTKSVSGSPNKTSSSPRTTSISAPVEPPSTKISKSPPAEPPAVKTLKSSGPSEPPLTKTIKLSGDPDEQNFSVLAEKLCSAAWNDLITEVENFAEDIKIGSYVNRPNSRGQSALYCAARQGHYAVVKALLGCPHINIDLQIEPHLGTALHGAAFAGKADVVLLLVSKGASLTIKNKIGLTAQQEATGAALDAFAAWLYGENPEDKAPPKDKFEWVDETKLLSQVLACIPIDNPQQLNHAQQQFLDSFFLGYRKFWNAEILFEKFKALWPTDKTRVCWAIQRWGTYYPWDLKPLQPRISEMACQESLVPFESLDFSSRAAYRAIHSQDNKTDYDPTEDWYTIDGAASAPGGDARGTLLNAATSKELAIQFTLYQDKMWRKICEVSCFEAPKKKTPEITEFTTHFNALSAWIQTQILTTVDLTERKDMVRKIFSFCKELRLLQNYFALFAINAAFQTAAIFRLKQTWTEEDPEYQQLAKVTTCQGNSKEYRNSRKESVTGQKPCIPQLGLLFTDLIHLDDAMPSRSESNEINFTKLFALAKCVQQIFDSRRLNYHMAQDPFLQSLILSQCDQNPINLTADDLFAHSLFIEPRPGRDRPPNPPKTLESFIPVDFVFPDPPASLFVESDSQGSSPANNIHRKDSFLRTFIRRKTGEGLDSEGTKRAELKGAKTNDALSRRESENLSDSATGLDTIPSRASFKHAKTTSDGVDLSKRPKSNELEPKRAELKHSKTTVEPGSPRNHGLDNKPRPKSSDGLETKKLDFQQPPPPQQLPISQMLKIDPNYSISANYAPLDPTSKVVIMRDDAYQPPTIPQNQTPPKPVPVRQEPERQQLSQTPPKAVTMRRQEEPLPSTAILASSPLPTPPSPIHPQIYQELLQQPQQPVVLGSSPTLGSSPSQKPPSPFGTGTRRATARSSVWAKVGALDDES